MTRDDRQSELVDLCEALCRDELSESQQLRLQELVTDTLHLGSARIDVLDEALVAVEK